MSSDRGIRWTRLGATLLVAVPALGFGFALLWQAVAEGATFSLNQAFHLASGLALLVLFADFAVAITRSTRPSNAVLLGAVGFAASLLSAIALELLGPPALLGLIIVCAGWAIRIAYSARTSMENVDQAR